MIEKYFTETSNKVELWINRVRINRSRPVQTSNYSKVRFKPLIYFGLEQTSN